ncbi:MAG TPA: NlpC/P60 family protein [Sedimentisphaerales bacterium]|nr:NlpC/P60 family protein [Sedimentisphaerales bacterium]
MNSAEITELLLGIPFLDGGRTCAGADCYGLLMIFAKELGVDLPDMEYERGWAERGANYLMENAHGCADEISKEELEPGDVIMFETYPGVASHVGIFIGEDRFIHTTDKHGAIAQHLSHQPYCRRINSFFRLKRAL